MATLINSQTQQWVTLRPIHSFGRHASLSRTRLDASDVSNLHAIVRWRLGQWDITDQSRNGTFLNDQRLTAGQSVPLTTGARLRFGALSTQHWLVQDLAAPQTCLAALDAQSESRVLEESENLLPDQLTPLVNIYCANGQWWIDTSDGARPLTDGDPVELGSQRWEFVLGTPPEATLQIQRPPEHASDSLHFAFNVSQNEEHVTLTLVMGAQRIPLGERIHHYTLLTLARQRLADQERGIAPPDCGWLGLEALARMLGVDTAYVNIQIFRARQQVARSAAAAADPAALLERRRGEIRFGAQSFVITKGERQEGRMAL